MTKSLTEQWREGTLPRGCYYIKLRDGSIKQTDYDNISKTFDTEYFRYNVSVKKVLAPVPSYDEYNELVQKIHILNEQNTKQYNELCEEIKKNNILEKKLAIATKALKKYESAAGWGREAFLALKEMEGVK